MDVDHFGPITISLPIALPKLTGFSKKNSDDLTKVSPDIVDSGTNHTFERIVQKAHEQKDQQKVTI